VLSLIAVTKYRKELQTSATRSQDLRLVYELELEREVRARREHELGWNGRCASGCPMRCASRPGSTWLSYAGS